MRKTTIALFAALPATLLMMSWSYALPSCCQRGNSPTPINSLVSAPERTPRALNVRIQAPVYRELPRQTARVSPQRSGTLPLQTTAARPVSLPAANPASPSPAACCQGVGTGYRSGAYNSWRQVGANVDYPALPTGCCGGCGYRGYGAAANLRGYWASGAYGQGWTQSNGPACCAVDNVQTSPGLSVSNRNANPVPATAVQARTTYSWGVYPAGAGPFGKPGYFPGARTWQNTW
jgi:hypothetical protein